MYLKVIIRKSWCDITQFIIDNSHCKKKHVKPMQQSSLTSRKKLSNIIISFLTADFVMRKALK